MPNDLLINVQYFISPETGIAIIEHHRSGGKWHRDPTLGPAKIERRFDGSLSEEHYCWNGKRHRDDGPASIEYFADGGRQLEKYYQHGVLTRDPKVGPAVILRNEQGVVIHEVFVLGGIDYRDPLDGPYEIKRNSVGDIIEQVFSAGKDRPLGSAPRTPPAPPKVKAPPRSAQPT
jgi:hypothetical protein